MWLHRDYDVRNVRDFRTMAALPDLIKHEACLVRYRRVHFYNNALDDPPHRCRIDYADALRERCGNLVQAVERLFDKFYSRELLTFKELSYAIHLVSDLHQPFHGKESAMCVVCVVCVVCVCACSDWI